MTQFIKGDVQKWISQYVQVRDLKRALEEKQKETGQDKLLALFEEDTRGLA